VKRRRFVELGALLGVQNAFIASRSHAETSPAPISGRPSISRSGTELSYQTVSLALAALKDGDTLNIPAGSYPGQCGRVGANNVRIRGVGGRAMFDTAVDDKAVFVVSGNDVTLENVGAAGVRIAPDNGALVRGEGGNLTLINCFTRDCNVSVLTGGPATRDSALIVTDCDFEGNSTAEDPAHGIYAGICARLVVNGGRIADMKGKVPGHLVKSRAAVTEIHGTLLDKVHASRCIDVPEGGMLVIDGAARLVNSTVARNREMIAYGAELPRDATNRCIPRFAVNEIHIAATVVFAGANPKDNLPAYAWLIPTVLRDLHRNERMPRYAAPS